MSNMTENKLNQTDRLLEVKNLRTTFRTISGEVYRIDYPTDTQDAPIVTIVTEDGNEWITDDYIAPRHTPLQITFSTNSTEDVTDDEIISIASTWTR